MAATGKNYLDRLRQIKAVRDKGREDRRKRIEARCGKELNISEEQIVNFISRKKVNTQMQHCILKVFVKMAGSEKERFISAFNICEWVFSTYGYQAKRSLTLTAKGMQNNLRHRREFDAGMKASRYNAMAERLFGGAVRDQSKIKELEALEREAKAEKLRKEKERARKKKEEEERIAQLMKKRVKKTSDAKDKKQTSIRRKNKEP